MNDELNPVLRALECARIKAERERDAACEAGSGERVMIVGFSGRIGSGKSAACEYLRRARGFVVLGFADALKVEVAARLRRTLEAYAAEHYSRSFLDHLGMSGAVYRLLYVERSPVTRALLQEYGTDVRRADDSEYWIKVWCASLPTGAHVAVPDVRFVNEAEAIRASGGRLVRVERPGGSVPSDHSSESSIASWAAWDAVIQNDGTLAGFEAAVEAFVSSHGQSIIHHDG